MSSASDSIEAQVWQELMPQADDYRVVRSFWLASLTLLFYEIMVTYDDEIEFMWHGRFVWTRLLYFVNRYFPFINLIFDNIFEATARSSDLSLCNFWYQWFLYANFIMRISMSGILIMRLYLMYRCNRTLLFTLCAMLIVELAIETTLIAEVIYNLKDITLPADITISTCVAVGIKKWAWAYWVPVMVWESLLLALSLYRSAQQAREEAGTPRLMAVLLRDSVLYFGGALASILANFIVWRAQVMALFFALIPVNIALNSVLGCRMMLHIARAGRKHQQAIAEQAIPLASRGSVEDDGDDGKDGGDNVSDPKPSRPPSPSLARSPRTSSTAPLKSSTSDHHSASPSQSLSCSPESSAGADDDVIDINSAASVRLNWDIYAKRNDLYQ